MRERLGEYALSLNPDKTRLIEFGRFAADKRAGRSLGKLETFKFLGFTFICGRSRRGRFAMKRKIGPPDASRWQPSSRPETRLFAATARRSGRSCGYDSEVSSTTVLRPSDLVSQST
jgi:hypothetical protein